ncbi:MAG: hypothetical protein IJ343_15690 [Clostridia bacterium]|nr:hypothetical protein [Clostridia bacterium]
MKKLRLSLILALLGMLLCTGALADDVYVVKDASAVSSVTTDRSYLRVCCPLEDSVPVTLTVRDGWGYLTFQRDYGVRSGSFRSEDVYLRLDGGSASYTVTLQAGSRTHSFRVDRTQPRLTDTGVYAHGLSLSEMNGGRSNKSAVIIDAYALENSTLSVPLVSGGMQVGYASFTVKRGELTVSAMLTVDGTIDKATVYVARDALTAQTLGANRFTGTKTKLNRSISLNGSPYAAVMLQLTVSYDGATVQTLQTDPRFAEEQAWLWEMMRLTTASEAVG